MTKILEFFDGKKTILLGIAALIVGYLVTGNVINGQLGTLILAILNVLAGGASIATTQVFGKSQRMGKV